MDDELEQLMTELDRMTVHNWIEALVREVIHGTNMILDDDGELMLGAHHFESWHTMNATQQEYAFFYILGVAKRAIETAKEAHL